jgi:triosephosphate isomerase
MSKNNYSKKGEHGKIVIGNWKMNPPSLEEAKHIITKTRNVTRKLERTTVVVCPPFPFISYVVPRKHRPDIHEIFAGAQNVFFEDSGAFTGEVSTAELVSLGVDYVIVGHSERRYPQGTQGAVVSAPATSTAPATQVFASFGESDLEVSKKAAKVAQAGMIAVLCVGEKMRDSTGEYLDVLRDELKASLQVFPKKSLSQLIIAYEPIWAIGARTAMTPDLVCETALFIKKVLSDMYGQHEVLNVPILYGGSVNFRNAADIITLGQVDGLLVGRESVNIPGFTELLKAVDAIG